MGVFRVVGFYIKNHVSGCKTGKGVDMPVGVVTLEGATCQPQHPLCPHAVGERFLNFGTFIKPVPVDGEHAAFGGEDGSFAV